MDLRAEPLVITVPVIEKNRYYSVQLIDAYTFNFAYISSGATGNDGGGFLIAGPGWKGQTPDGVKEVIRSETEFVFAVFRTQLFDPGDLDNVKKVQAGYKAQPLPLLQTDAGKLKIVLKNLLDNAIKFTKQGTVTIRARSQENGVEIRVQDNGSGIPPEALEQIFEPFYQVDEAARLPGGTGLGLSIVQRLVALLGGRIRVESVVGSGSVFRVWVPVEIPEG